MSRFANCVAARDTARGGSPAAGSTSGTVCGMQQGGGSFMCVTDTCPLRPVWSLRVDRSRTPGSRTKLVPTSGSTFSSIFRIARVSKIEPTFRGGSHLKAIVCSKRTTSKPSAYRFLGERHFFTISQSFAAYRQRIWGDIGSSCKPG